ncbi:MAG: hypothetical protein ACK55I_15825, partial [bacterium]
VEKQEELKIHIEGIKSSVRLEKENMQRFEKLKLENKNEKITNGISNDAKLKIEIISLNVVEINNTALLKNSKKLNIKIKFDDSIKSTSSRYLNDLNFIQEIFEYNVESLDSIINIVVYEENSINSIGDANIPIKHITNQEENEINLEINDHKNNRTIFIINLKVTII